MKKIIILVVAISAIVFLGFYVSKLMKNEGKSDTELIEFAIKDTETVDKVIISDAFGLTFEMVKNGKEWTDKEGGCISQSSAEFVLDAFRKIEFKGYINEKSQNHFTKLMSSQHTKVEIFQNGKWTKTWFIGPAAQDHYGQIMLLDSKEQGKSDIPVLMKIKGVNGIIEPRFFADKRKWMCTNIFNIPMHKLAKVDVKFYDEPERSFSVVKKKTDLNVFQQGKKLSNFDTSMVFRYLQNYQKIHFDIPNYELTPHQVDSLKATQPFAELTVQETDKNTTKLKFFRIALKEVSEEGIATYGDKDRDRFWCELENGQLVKCQYFVFNPLILGHIYFPMDISMLKTEDGILPK